MNFQSDIRGLLQYVPLFRGKVFVIDIDVVSPNDAIKAEIMMDLKALQQVGVKLVVSMEEKLAQDFFDHAAEVELHVSSKVYNCDDEGTQNLLDRGQLFVVKREETLLSDALIEMSCSLKASKLICISAIPELLDSEDNVVKFIHADNFSEKVTEKSNVTHIQAVAACHAGVPRVHLLNVNQQGVLLNELFSTEGVGSMFYTDSYRSIRPVREEDISEMLGMIGRSVRNTHLVPRTFEDVRDNIDAYYVMEVDENVVGCGALYEYGDCGEVACLYVKLSHEGTGYGASMVEFLEEKAASKGLTYVFALSNRAAKFFKNIGYNEMALNELPQERLKRLLDSGRESFAFKKAL